MTNTIIEDTFSECFSMWYSRILITAVNEKLALAAAQSTIGYATSIIMCTAEAGIEQIVTAEETPDGRPGVIIQIWTRRSKQIKDEVLSRLSQCAMTTPTTSIFNLIENGTKTEPIGKLIAYFGDGHQQKVNQYNREMWEIPCMDGSFYIDENFGFRKGIAGGLLILIGKDTVETLKAAMNAVDAIKSAKVKAITSFPNGICRAGSKIGSKYSFLDESTNHRFCPTLKTKVKDSLLPPEATCVYEIVINAISEEEIIKTMQIAITRVKENPNLLKITSSNFDGELGKIKINLRELV